MSINEEMFSDSPDNETIDSADKLKYLTEMIAKLNTANQELAEAEKDVEEKKKVVQHLSGVVIPGIFEELGVKKISLLDGREVKIHSEWVGSISKENKMAAYSWLEENGHGALIKKDIEIKLKKGDDETAAKIREWLIANKIMNFKEDSSVHYQTLKAFINEQKADGKEIPDELFGTFLVKETRVK